VTAPTYAWNYKVWDESFLFVLSSVLGIGTWFCLTLRRRDADLFGRQKWWWPLAVLWICAAIWLGGRFYFYLKGWDFPDLGAVLALMFGAVFGTFVARFVLQLFGPGFSTYDGLIAAATLLLLSIAYSMPSYPGLWTALFERLGGTTIKTPLLELAFAERSPRPPPYLSAAQFDAPATAFPLPNDAGQALSWFFSSMAIENNYLQRDAKYIKFVDGPAKANFATVILKDTGLVLQPLQVLVLCLHSYVNIVRDSKLTLININPATMAMLQIHHKAIESLARGYPASEKSGSFPKQQWEALTQSVKDVLNTIRTNFHIEEDLSKDCDPQKINRLIPSLSYGLDYLYLQPYLTIATAELLWVQGSRDEAVLVLAQWIDAWNCAHDTAGASTINCLVKASHTANQLPDWFLYRAEFEFSAFAFAEAGPDSPYYHAFLIDFARRFDEYVSPGIHGVALATALKACTEGKGNLFPSALADDDETGKKLIRLLIENQDSVNISQRRFLTDKQKPEINNILDKSRLVLGFPPKCLPAPPDHLSKDQAVKWIKTLSKDQAEKQINVGFLELAAAARAERIASSADDRRWARDIRKRARADIEMGQRGLLPDDPQNPATRGLADRLFEDSHEKELYMKASRALDQLNDAER
jgi:hypothetical protein